MSKSWSTLPTVPDRCYTAGRRLRAKLQPSLNHAHSWNYSLRFDPFSRIIFTVLREGVRVVLMKSDFSSDGGNPFVYLPKWQDRQI
jgi:hypothetical protein